MAGFRKVSIERRQEMLEEVFAHLRRCGILHTKKELSKALGVANSNLSQAFGGNKTYLTDNLFIYRIGDTFGDIFDMDWLMTGEGNMLRKSEGQTMNANGGTNVQAQGNSNVVLQSESLTEIEKELVRLKAENETLKKENDWLRNMVSKLTVK